MFYYNGTMHLTIQVIKMTCFPMLIMTITVASVAASGIMKLSGGFLVPPVTRDDLAAVQHTSSCGPSKRVQLLLDSEGPHHDSFFKTAARTKGEFHHLRESGASGSEG